MLHEYRSIFLAKCFSGLLYWGFSDYGKGQSFPLLHYRAKFLCKQEGLASKLLAGSHVRWCVEQLVVKVALFGDFIPLAGSNGMTFPLPAQCWMSEGKAPSSWNSVWSLDVIPPEGTQPLKVCWEICLSYSSRRVFTLQHAVSMEPWGYLKSLQERSRWEARCPPLAAAAPLWKDLSFPWVPFEFLITVLCLDIIRTGEIPTYLVLPTCMATFMKALPFSSTRT